jgi:hypothetical protein
MAHACNWERLEKIAAQLFSYRVQTNKPKVRIVTWVARE